MAETGVMTAAKQRWQGRPLLAAAVRTAVVAVPVAASVAVTALLVAALPAPASDAERAMVVVGLVLVGLATMRAASAVARRLLPLSALLTLSLAFPDRMPSRLRVAMRVTSEARLRDLAEATRRHGLPTEPALAAERILELVAALSYHDRITRGHAERVRALAGLVAAELGIRGEELERLQWAGLLHDIGKLAIPSEVLNKPGRLSAHEWELIKTHPGEGARLLEPLRGWLGDAVDVAGQHHERVDGTGYPLRLEGSEICLAARIVSVADVFDVITSTRSYKVAESAAEAREEIARCAGAQFDPAVVRAFLAIPLSRLRRVMGPLTVLAQLPVLNAVPAVGSATASVTGVTLASSVTMATLGVVAASALPTSTVAAIGLDHRRAVVAVAEGSDHDGAPEPGQETAQWRSAEAVAVPEDDRGEAVANAAVPVRADDEAPDAPRTLTTSDAATSTAPSPEPKPAPGPWPAPTPAGAPRAEAAEPRPAPQKVDKADPPRAEKVDAKPAARADSAGAPSDRGARADTSGEQDERQHPARSPKGGEDATGQAPPKEKEHPEPPAQPGDRHEHERARDTPPAPRELLPEVRPLPERAPTLPAPAEDAKDRRDDANDRGRAPEGDAEG